MRTCVFIAFFAWAIPVVFAADGKLTKPAEEIQRLCFREAGIPPNEPNHAITEKELDVVLKCASRYIERS